MSRRDPPPRSQTPRFGRTARSPLPAASNISISRHSVSWRSSTTVFGVRPAAAYVEFHMVGYCKRDDCDEDGNACGFVCADHLDALEYTAECTARELHPRVPRGGCPGASLDARPAIDRSDLPPIFCRSW